MFWGYCLLVIASMLVSGHPLLQWMCICMWVVGHWWWIRTKAAPSKQVSALVGRAFAGQWPGIAAILACVLDAWFHVAGAWGDGFLELWIHPFMPIVERLPAGALWHYSNAFWVASAVPVCIMVVTVVYGRWFSAMATHAEGRFSREGILPPDE